MKRTCRKLSDETRRKISEALKGKTKTDSHRKALSVALTRYWATIPVEGADDEIKGDVPMYNHRGKM